MTVHLSRNVPQTSEVFKSCDLAGFVLMYIKNGDDNKLETTAALCAEAPSYGNKQL